MWRNAIGLHNWFKGLLKVRINSASNFELQRSCQNLFVHLDGYLSESIRNLKIFRHGSEICLDIEISWKSSRLLSEDMVPCIGSNDITLLRDVPLEVIVVNEDVIQGDPCSISIPLNFNTLATERLLGTTGVAWLYCDVNSCKDEVDKLNIDRWVKEWVEGSTRVL